MIRIRIMPELICLFFYFNIVHRIKVPSFVSSFVAIVRLAQSVEHQTFNLRVMGSSPMLGDIFFCFLFKAQWNTKRGKMYKVIFTQ